MKILNRYTNELIKVISYDLSSANLRDANLSDANLSDANLRDANLSSANLSSANLRGANLRDANLSDANLSSANLRGANLCGANLRDANLSDANLRGANLRGANLCGANLRDANLSDANLSDANLSGANLSSANISGAEDIPTIDNIHSKVFESASIPGCLNMNSWHTCETTHCRAGWVVTLAGIEGKKLEEKVGSSLAATLIYFKSDPNLTKVPNFHSSDEEALQDMKFMAEKEKNNVS